MDVAFRYTTIRNCRRYFKRCYVLNKDIDQNLVNKLEDFGVLEVNHFSKYSPLAKDAFKIRFDDQIEISGTMSSPNLYLTVSKDYISLGQTLEQEINSWYYCADQDHLI